MYVNDYTIIRNIIIDKFFKKSSFLPVEVVVTIQTIFVIVIITESLKVLNKPVIFVICQFC